MHTDTFVQAAEWHRRQGVPCQDSVLAQVKNKQAILAVSDGCSSGSGSEFGAQAVTRVLANEDWSLPLHRLAPLLKPWKDLGQVQESAMLATALRCTVEQDDGGGLDATFECQGDGVGGMLLDDGSIWSWCTEWDNTPPYPWYENSDLQNQWMTQAKPGLLKIWKNDDLISTAELSPQNQKCTWIKPPMNWTAIWLGSDGWLTLGMTVPELAREVTSFKNKEGAFLKRRLSRMLATLSKQGVEPADDLGMVALIKE